MYAYFLGACSFIITVWAVVEIFMKILELKRKPDRIQNETLKEHAERLEKHRLKFMNDQKRLDDIEQSNHVVQKALLALLSHAINGNDIDDLKRAKKDLQNYLIGKG